MMASSAENHEQSLKQVEKSTTNSDDAIAEFIGEVGKWQLQNIAVIFFLTLPGLVVIFSVPFVFYKTDYWCENEILDLDTNFTIPEDIRNMIHPGETTKHEANIDTSCLVKCDTYEYDKSFWKESVIMTWDLVCEKQHLELLAKMAIFVGLAVGTFGAGWISDTYGRKTAILLMSQLLFGSGILASTMSRFMGFVILWFVTGIAAIGVYTACFVWAMESVSGRWKSIVGMIMAFCWPASSLLMAGLGAACRNWKLILQVACAVHIATPILINLVPESPRWLLASKNIERRMEAKHILRKAAELNGKVDENIDERLDSLIFSNDGPEMKENKKEIKFIDIFRHRVLVKRTLVMYWNWFTLAFIIYGLRLNWQTLTGNLIINVIIGSFLEIVGRLISIILIIKIGRRLPFIVLLFGAGASFLIMLAFEKDAYTNNWPIVTCAMFGYFCISSNFGIIWIYTSELYPTNSRNAAVGSCSLLARIGGIVSSTVGQLADVHVSIPPLLFAFSALFALALSFLLPETLNTRLPDTIEECKLQSISSIENECLNWPHQLKRNSKQPRNRADK